MPMPHDAAPVLLRRTGWGRRRDREVVGHRVPDLIARSWGMSPVSLLPGDTDDALIRTWSRRRFDGEGWMPVRELDGRMVVATAHVPTARRRAHVEAVLGHEVTFGTATSWQIQVALDRIYGAPLGRSGFGADEF